MKAFACAVALLIPTLCNGIGIANQGLLGKLPPWAAWYDNAFVYRQPLYVTSPIQVTNYQVKITLQSTNFEFFRALTNGADVRITEDNGTNLVPYYIKSISGSTAELWAKPVLLSAASTNKLYLYFGNASPASFTMPPTGIFTRPTSALQTNYTSRCIVYDSDTAAYWAVLTDQAGSGAVALSTASSPAGPWSTNTDIITHGVAGSWDYNGLENGVMIKDGSTWYCFYDAEPTNTFNGYQIGVASAPAITGPWTKSTNNPVIALGATNTWESYRAFEPSVIKANGTFYLFYTGESNGAASPREEIGFATASSLLGPWTKHSGNPVIPLNGVLTPDQWTVADPAVYGPINGYYWMVYSGGVTAGIPWNICVAQSKDLTNWFRGGSIYCQGVGTEWDTSNVVKPGLSLVSNVWYMPYAGPLSKWATASMSSTNYTYGFDPNCVFDYFDDFNGASRDVNLWGLYDNQTYAGGNDSISNGILTINNGVDGRRTLFGRRLFGVGKLMEVYMQSLPGNGDIYRWSRIGMGNMGYPEYPDRGTEIVTWNNSKWQRYERTTAASMAQSVNTNWTTHHVFLQSTNIAWFQINTNAWESMSIGVTNAFAPFLYTGLYLLNSTTNQINCDYVMVRQYITNEPSVTVSFPGRARW